MRIDWSPETGSLDLGTLSRLYAAKMLKPSDVVRAVYRRLDRHDHVWISRVPLAEAVARAEEIERKDPALPLYGIPFAVKDNIDVAGMPTTAACKEFARRPARSATVVDRLIQAGAILVGKTNLDQFATGLVGVRSPYGPVAQSVRPALHLRRLELGLRRGGLYGHGQFCAGHGHRGFRSRARGIQQHRRAEADAGLAELFGRAAGVPDARLRLDPGAHLRRCPAGPANGQGIRSD